MCWNAATDGAIIRRGSSKWEVEIKKKKHTLEMSTKASTKTWMLIMGNVVQVDISYQQNEWMQYNRAEMAFSEWWHALSSTVRCTWKSRCSTFTNVTSIVNPPKNAETVPSGIRLLFNKFIWITFHSFSKYAQWINLSNSWYSLRPS